LDEPELHLGEDIVVPDLSGWRRERMPELPDEPYATLAPDWICEVLSKSTEAFDRSDKLPLYVREQVKHVWLVDPDVKTLEIFRLEGANYVLVATHTSAAHVREEPFDAIELQLDLLWTA
jgi:Uma2 family endonuclease